MFWFKRKKYEIALGAVPEPFDIRDHRIEEVLRAFPSFDWEKGFDIEEKLGIKIPIKNQGSSGSCVGQAWSYYAGILEAFEIGIYREKSARWIYSQIYLPNGGAYLRQGGKILTNQGVVPSVLFPDKRTEMEMRERKDATKDLEAIAKVYLKENYLSIPERNIDEIASIMAMNNGFVSGVKDDFTQWNSAFPKMGIKDDNGHALYFCKARKINGRKYLGFINSWGCYDKRTEILTDKGWKSFENLDGTEKVATLNPDIHELEYQKIKKKFIYDYDGYLWHYKARDIDLLITPNHKLYIQPTRRNKWLLLEADKIWIKGFRMKKNAKWQGREKRYYQIGKKKIPMDLWLEFLGYFISEGHISFNKFWRKERIRKRKYKVKGELLRDPKTGKFIPSPKKKKKIIKECWVKEKPYKQFTYITGISQKTKNSKIEKCLSRLPWKFSYYNHTFSTNNKDLYLELKPLGKAPQKYIPNYIKQLSSRQLRIFFKALMLGDGSGNPLKKWTYYTSSKRLANDVQEILLKMGWAGDISFTDRRGRKNKKGITKFIEYRIGIKTKELTPGKKWKPKLVPYKGKVYCIEVPNHLIYVRRNGKAVWSGNSDWGDKGWGWLGEEWINAGRFFNPKTIMDLPSEVERKMEKPHYIFNNNLKYGMKNNEEVKKLQECLAYEECFLYPEFTGNFYGYTLRAVRCYQAKYGIEPISGFVGPKTRAMLNKHFA